MGSLAEMSQDEISTLVNRCLGNDYRLVAELAVGGQEAIILGYGVGQIVLSFTIGDIDLRPGRCQKHPRVIALILIQDVGCWLSSRVLKCHRRIHETAIEEDPACLPNHMLPVVSRYLKRPLGKR